MQQGISAITATALSLLPIGQPLLMGSTASAIAAIAVALHHTPAFAQDTSGVAQIANAITVRIEGATQGSGVLIKRDGDIQTVLTAWHVVSPNQDGEEIDIIHKNGKDTIKVKTNKNMTRIGNIDMGLITFRSNKSFAYPNIDKNKNLQFGDQIYVNGYPVEANGMKLNQGFLVASADAGIDQGYQLLYNNFTSKGMSGGPILNTHGKLIGIHGRGEQNIQMGVNEKTNINQGIPINYLLEYLKNGSISMSDSKPTSYQDYYAIAINSGRINQPQTMLRMTSQMQKKQPHKMDAYFLADFAYKQLGNTQKASQSFEHAKSLMKKYGEDLITAYKTVHSDPANALNLVESAKSFGGITADSYADFDYLRALAYYNLKQYEKSIQSAFKALKWIKNGNTSLFMREMFDGDFALIFLLYNKLVSEHEIADYDSSVRTATEALSLGVENYHGSIKASIYSYRAISGSLGNANIDSICSDYKVAIDLDDTINQNSLNHSCKPLPEAVLLSQRVSEHLCDARLQNKLPQDELLMAATDGLKDALGFSHDFSKQLVWKIFRDDVTIKCPGVFTIKVRKA